MAHSSILGGERAASLPTGKDVDALGPSDSSDSGSDVQASPPSGLADSHGRMTSVEGRGDSDASGTGERGGMGGDDEAVLGADISPDRIDTDPDGDGDVFNEVPANDMERIADELLAEDPEDEDGDALEPLEAPVQRPEEPAKGR